MWIADGWEGAGCILGGTIPGQMILGYIRSIVKQASKQGSSRVSFSGLGPVPVLISLSDGL